MSVRVKKSKENTSDKKKIKRKLIITTSIKIEIILAIRNFSKSDMINLQILI